MERLSLTTSKMRQMTLIGVAFATGLLGGCVNVTAPDKPIEINLNINITQQVVYKLDGQAKALIDEHPGIF
jgi:outer membrane murein-binding lipoprotein Lpp